MPKGNKPKYAPKKNYKGAHRHFTDEDELKRQFEEEQRKKASLAEQGGEGSGGQSSDEDGDAAGKGKEKAINRRGEPGQLPDSESGSSSEEEDDDEDHKAKGVQHLIQKEIENPNRVVQKTIKIKDLTLDELPPSVPAPTPEGEQQGLNRKEREEVERQKAKARYQKLHAEGKTDEAQADLARLAVIKKQREDAAKRREAEVKARESAKTSAKATALGKTA